MYFVCMGDTGMKVSFWRIAFAASIILLMCGLGCEEKAADTELPAKELRQAGVDAEQPGTQAAVEGPPSNIVVENPVYDFGDIDPGSKHTGEFKFTNQGQGVLNIKKIQSTCGCTVPQLKKKTYEPGESGTITVTFRPGHRSGPVSKNLYILSNDKDDPRARLTIKAKVTQKISYEPKRFRLKLNEENAGMGEITIKSLDGKSFAISRIQIRPDSIKVDYDPATEAKEFVLSPKVDPNKIRNMRNGNIILKLTHPSQKSISIPFDVLPPFKSDPATLIALNADPAKPVRKTVYILSNYISEEMLEDKYVIVVDIVPPENLGTKRHFNSKLTVNIAGGEQLVINCVGSVPVKTAKKASN
jgi:hypothetical protein